MKLSIVQPFTWNSNYFMGMHHVLFMDASRCCPNMESELTVLMRLSLFDFEEYLPLLYVPKDVLLVRLLRKGILLLRAVAFATFFFSSTTNKKK